MTAEPEISCNFYLGIVRSPEHNQRLCAIAHWLDQNKFSCTYSQVAERAMFDVSPHDPKEWESRELFSKDGFAFYAAEHLIHALGRELGEKS